METQKQSKHLRKRKKKLLNSIREQIEFYFSDANLRHDRFMRQLIGAEDPEVMGRQSIDLNEFFKFNKVCEMTDNIRDISLALESSKCLSLDSNQLTVKRIDPFVNFDMNCDESTVYVERLPPNADHHWIRSVFEPFGRIQYLKVPVFRHNHNIMGFAFIEFESSESALKVIQYFNQLSNNDNKNDEQMDNNSETDQTSSETKTQTEGSLKRSLEITEEVIESKKAKLSEETDQSINVSEVMDEKCETNPEMTEKTKKKKKRRRKRIILSTDSGEDNQKELISNLRVMSKKEWKQWKNKYLKLQKQTMSSIKRSLLVTNEDNDRQQTDCQLNKVDNTSSDRTYELGLIIELSFSHPSNDFIEKQFIRNIRLMADKNVIQYIDLDSNHIEFKEDQTICGKCYIRTNSSDDCKRLVENERFRQLGSICVLEGNQESDYWHKIFRQRDEKKFNNNNQNNNKTQNKIRGFDRIIRKAETSGQTKANKYIKFE